MPSQEILDSFDSYMKSTRIRVPPGVVACGFGTWVRAADIVRVSTPKTKQEVYANGQCRAWVTLNNGDRIPCPVQPRVILRRWADAIRGT